MQLLLLKKHENFQLSFIDDKFFSPQNNLFYAAVFLCSISSFNHQVYAGNLISWALVHLDIHFLPAHCLVLTEQLSVY